jgi:hypothetical protein
MAKFQTGHSFCELALGYVRIFGSDLTASDEPSAEFKKCSNETFRDRFIPPACLKILQLMDLDLDSLGCGGPEFGNWKSIQIPTRCGGPGANWQVNAPSQHSRSGGMDCCC